MKIKRWMVLTVIFTALGGAIVVSGCQPSNTASATTNMNNATPTINTADCSQCIVSCSQSCIDEACISSKDCVATCFTTCGTFNPFSVECTGSPIQFCFDCSCAFFTECNDNLTDDSESDN